MGKRHVQCTRRWVKGHQDRKMPLHEIDEEGRLNMEVDKLATQAYNQIGAGHTEAEGTVFAAEVYRIMIDGAKVTSKVKQRVIDQCGAEAIRQYMLHKHQLSEGKFDRINWFALAAYLRTFSLQRRATQVKLHHNWIPTNSFLFQQRRVQSDKCPLCESAVETASHVRWCKSPGARRFRKERMEQLVRELRGANTSPEIIQCWQVQVGILSNPGWNKIGEVSGDSSSTPVHFVVGRAGTGADV